MRVIYLHQYFTTPVMSGGTRSYEMARRLVDAGHDVHMVTSDRESSGKPHKTSEAGIDVTWIPVPYSNHMGTLDRIRAFFDFARKAARIAASLDGDVVFATSTPLTIALPAVYASKRKKIPMVFEVRDLWPEMPIAMGTLRDPVSRFAATKLERFAYQHSAHVVALSPGMKDGVVASGYPSERVTVIPNSCDLDLFHSDGSRGLAFRAQHDWLQGRPLVVYAGTIGAVNGVGYLARLAEVTLKYDPEIRFLVIGTGKEEARVRALARELAVLNQNFFMLPNVEKSRIPDVLSAADIATSLFIDIPEMWKNSANKFFDALASGTPIAINYSGWQAGLIHEHDVGLVLDATDISGSATKLAGALRDRQWLERAGRAARKLGEERFDREHLAARLEHVLRDTVDQATARPTKEAMLA